ncbi:hypothetical protein [Streptomyces sp. NPDC101455]|uniref:hypothetical protein n=1 Tax=Streptomyces sp. NPDC101455 TaxID=3366142 RepID=UPI00381789C3
MTTGRRPPSSLDRIDPPGSAVDRSGGRRGQSGELLERQLAEVKVPVSSYLADGMLHGHLNLTKSLPRIGSSLDFLAGAPGRSGAGADDHPRRTVT